MTWLTCRENRRVILPILEGTRQPQEEGRVMSMATASPSRAGASSAINVRLIVPFVNSVRSVFATMVKTPTTVQRPFLKTDDTPHYDVSSIIGC